MVITELAAEFRQSGRFILICSTVLFLLGKQDNVVAQSRPQQQSSAEASASTPKNTLLPRSTIYFPKRTKAKSPLRMFTNYDIEDGLPLRSVFSGFKDRQGNLWCALIKMGLENREIAMLLNIEVSSVKMAKYRLKKKFNIDESVSLRSYFESL